ncbi:MAG: signal peptidase I, partial [Treponema sp.]|nr:signal peptidase I [Treponema sp.]
MFDKWRRYSYAAQKNQRVKLLWFFFCFLILYIVYNVFTTFFFSMRVLENDTMRPGLRMGDRFIFSSCTVHSFLTGINILHESLPFKRGNIVLVDTDLRGNRHGFPALLDGFVRFFTAQRVSLFGKEEHLYM